MSDDIVERLRNEVDEWVQADDIIMSGMLRDAADEIERLRAVLRDAERALAAFTVESEP